MAILDLFDLSQKVAVVTGGSRGLGFAIGEALGQLGAAIALVARGRDELEAATASLRQSGIEAEAFTADLANAATSAPDLLSAIIERFGRIDILVNNAGASWAAPVENHSLEGLRKVLSLNIEAAFSLTQEVGRREFLPRGSGKILNVASVAGLRGNRPELGVHTSGYSASKGALVGFTRALATEWGPRGINVNALCPGYFHSKLTNSLLDRIGDQVRAATPLQRIAEVDDLMGAVAFLCSDASRHMTGQMLVVDGGLSAC